MLRSMGWVARRWGERTTASVPTGKWDQGELLYDISAADFAQLRADPATFSEMHRKYNWVSGPGWSAQREDVCVVYLLPSHFPDNRRFKIPNDAFERLRDDPSRFDEIYAAFRTDYV